MYGAAVTVMYPDACQMLATARLESTSSKVVSARSRNIDVDNKVLGRLLMQVLL